MVILILIDEYVLNGNLFCRSECLCIQHLIMNDINFIDVDLPWHGEEELKNNKAESCLKLFKGII